MWQGLRRRTLAGIVVLAGLAVLAPAASASVTASMSVTSSTPVAAGSSGNLGLDLKFTPSSSGGVYNDGPDSVTLNLPPGVLANASLDNGKCLQTADITGTTCQLGSGTVTAYADGLVPTPTDVSFYLVPPPAAGDLAGLAVAQTGTGDQIGTTNAIVIRPSGSADGVGVTLELTLPNSLDGVPIDVTEIDSTFTGTRFPATCPATPANITLSANSYNDPSATATASAPLPVSGCSALAFDPQYSLSAVRDASDKVVKVTTDITQAATESPSSSVSLALPYATLTPSLAGVKNLCAQGVASGTCKPVGSVTAQSPDYPKALTGQAYLTGSLSGLTLTLVFPAPFPLTLVGTVDLRTNVTTFTGLPDIPLTSLLVTLNGGPTGLFQTTCLTPTNTSTATLTDQNADKTAKPMAKFTVQGCPSTSSGGGGGGSSSGGASSSRPHVSSTRIAGLKTGKPSMRFTIKAARKGKLRSFTVKLPKGLSFRTHRAHKQRVVRGLKLKGGKLKSEKLSKGRLTITLRKATKRVTVAVSHRGLKESKALRKHARAKSKKKRLKRLRLTVIARNAKGKRTTIHVSVKHLGL
jgi:hypothetical protein